MKTLVVYHGKSFTRFTGIYQTISMELVDGLLYVHRRDVSTGTETLRAIFRDWERLEIEES